MKQVLFILLSIFIISSCVVNKRYQYLQHDDVNMEVDALVKDSVLRTYYINKFEYLLQPADIISIQFYSLTPEEFNFFSLKGGSGDNPNLFMNEASVLINGYLIDTNGNVEFPVVGKVNISGLSVYDAQSKILAIAEQYLENPVVELRLMNFRFTLLGEVNKEGVSRSYNIKITMLEAIGLAGGFTDFADKANIKIIRQSGGKSEVYYLDLLEENFINSPFYYINQNDVIIVPPLKQRPYQIYFGKNLALVISSLSLLLLVLNLAR